MRRFEAGHRELLGQFLLIEPRHDQGKIRLARAMRLQQRQFHPIGLRLHGVEEHARSDLARPGVYAFLRGVFAAFVGRREDLVSRPARRLVVGHAAERRGRARNRLSQRLHIEGHAFLHSPFPCCPSSGPYGSGRAGSKLL